MRSLKSIVFIVIFGVASGVVTADDHTLTASEAIAARQDQMKAYRQGLRVLGDMARGNIDYDAAAASESAAAVLAAAMQDPIALWPEGTDMETADRTRALPAIWANFDGFSDRSNAMLAAAEALNAAAGTDLDALRAAMGPVGDACSACHRSFRGRR